MVWLFSLTLGLSAVLLFWVQPMFARMVLPLLGGVPAVWNVAMVFFQAALLAGYLYSHLGDRYLRPRVHAMVHMPLSLLPLLALPIAVASGWQPPADGAPALWLLALLIVSVGLPFFLVATTAPLLQRWFAVTGHRDAHNPYFLYSASNIGSIAALLASIVIRNTRQMPRQMLRQVVLQLAAPGHLWLLASLALGTPALSVIGMFGAALTVGIKRGGLLLSLLVLPLYIPTLIFGAEVARRGSAGLDATTPLLMLAGLTLAVVALMPFAAAAVLRMGLR